MTPARLRVLADHMQHATEDGTGYRMLDPSDFPQAWNWRRSLARFCFAVCILWISAAVVIPYVRWVL